MRTLILFIAVLLSSPSFAQSVKGDINLTYLLFEKFTEGQVMLKNGSVEKVPLNYNIANQNVVFIHNDKYLSLTGLETIDTVWIQQRKFVPVNDLFHEVLYQSENYGLLATYGYRTRPLTATSDKAGTKLEDDAAVSQTVTGVYVGRNHKGAFKTSVQPHFWLKKSGNFYQVDNKKQFLKYFSARSKPLVEAYAADNHIEFGKEEDMIRLINYCAKEGL